MQALRELAKQGKREQPTGYSRLSVQVLFQKIKNPSTEGISI
jgi:hypothetical protein